MNAPTYNTEEIEAKPAWLLAWHLSEFENDNAPIGWSKYIYKAEHLLTVFDIKKKTS